MAVYDLEEQEQLSEIKAWWERYGRLVTTVAVAAALASVGWQAWQWHQRKQSLEAADLYATVQRAQGAKDAVKAREAAGQIIEKFGGSYYADLAALLSAQVQLEAGDAKNARAQLGWAAEKANDPALRELARLRLAAVLFDENALDEALAQLALQPSEALRARYADLKGDILAAQGKNDEARAAYQAAVAALTEDESPLQNLITLKLEALGGAQ